LKKTRRRRTTNIEATPPVRPPEENTHVIEPYGKCKRVCRHNLATGREALQYKTRERINAEKARLLEEKKRTRRSVSSRRRCLYRRKLKKEGYRGVSDDDDDVEEIKDRE
jgi:hypothetical protein